jgi:hypothetical protein
MAFAMGVAATDGDTDGVDDAVSSPPPLPDANTKMITSTIATTPSPIPPNKRMGLKLIFHVKPRPRPRPRPLRLLKLFLLLNFLKFVTTAYSFRRYPIKPI